MIILQLIRSSDYKVDIRRSFPFYRPVLQLILSLFSLIMIVSLKQIIVHTCTSIPEEIKSQTRNRFQHWFKLTMNIPFHKINLGI